MSTELERMERRLHDRITNLAIGLLTLIALMLCPLWYVAYHWMP